MQRLKLEKLGEIEVTVNWEELYIQVVGNVQIDIRKSFLNGRGERVADINIFANNKMDMVGNTKPSTA